MTPLDLTIVIVTHNSEGVIRRCLDSIGAPLWSAVRVVDNGSSDGTLDVLHERGIGVLTRAANEGFGRAANRGAQAASTEHLCFLNPDCEVTDGLFEAGVEALRRSPRRCAAPLFDEGSGAVIEGRRPGYTRIKLVDDTLRANYGSPAVCEWLRGRATYHDRRWSWPYGACFFIARRCFLDLGGFDGRFFMYMEDVDLGRRLCATGGEVVSVEAAVRHEPQSGARIDSRRRLALLNAGRVRYASVQYGWAFAGLLTSLAWPSTMGRALVGRMCAW